MKDNHHNPLVENAKEELMLLYSDKTVISYTENIMRGDGVVSLNPEPGSSIKLYTEDDLFFGEIKYTQDLNFILKLPDEIIARKVIFNSDFMAMDFDAKNPENSKDYIFIYLNKIKLKIKKEEVSYNFSLWKEYVKYQIIELKPNNLLHVEKDNTNEIEPHSGEHIYKVTGINENVMTLASTVSGCCSHPKHESFEGWVRWRQDDVLLVNFGID
ncbi:MAG: hypothetical protein DI539_06360 [Flavobacterium psychrophilum]|nr:MAG: hypothetical protein DI539_06360 [Flavobacterium psychrophilum]